MPAPMTSEAAVRTFLRAQITGDADLLATAALPHAELGRLVTSPSPRPATGDLLAQLERLNLRTEPLGGGRHFVRAIFGSSIQLLVVHDTPAGARVDARYPLEAMRPDDERRRLIRQFYLALLLGDGERLAELAFDARGLELLVCSAPPAGEHGQLEHVAATMGLVQLQNGEPFVVPSGVEFVGPRHAELGIEVWSAITPGGELPFLLRRRDGGWKVIPFHFIQAALQARGGSIVS